MTESLNADFTRRVVVHTAAMEWQASPSPTVWRKRLDLAGSAEAGRVTSVVRYDADSAFPSHPHPGGEEILVLDGVFSDQHGDYPAGTFLLNPEGFSHAPFSREGCVLFVKLRQYPGRERRQIIVDTNTVEWQPQPAPGVSAMPLYAEAGYPEVIRLIRLAPGARMPAQDESGGAELFVLEGVLEDEQAQCGKGSWARYPAGGSLTLHSAQGCAFYLKTGHI
jgi:anti-sigma factor ChrR (cupin superfamily)